MGDLTALTWIAGWTLQRESGSPFTGALGQFGVMRIDLRLKMKPISHDAISLSCQHATRP